MVRNLKQWIFQNHDLQLGDFPQLMGIINVTPDSFSDGGQFFHMDQAIKQALVLAEAGANILDIGGESTRPGAAIVSEEEELQRVIPVIKELAKQTELPISIDTTKSAVALQALQAGASIVNDISGLTFDPQMVNVCRDFEAGIICMHIQGTPQTMQESPAYFDVVAEIRDYFLKRLSFLDQVGIPAERIVLDPGIGFGKKAEHNLEILSHIQEFRSLDRPVLIGHSRKRFLQKILGRPVEERTFGTLGISIGLAMQAVDILRIHEVQETRDTLLAWHAIANRLPTS